MSVPPPGDLPTACCSTGAASVLAVDTGYGQIAHKLRVDPRVSLRERCNARLLGAGSWWARRHRRSRFLRWMCRSSRDAGPSRSPACFGSAVEAWRGEAVVLIKPQFEAGREHVGKGGIVREQAGRDIAIERVRQCVTELAEPRSSHRSPITAWKGTGVLLHARFGEAES